MTERKGTVNVSDAQRAVLYSYTIQEQHIQGSISKHGQTRDKTIKPLCYIDIMPKLMDLGKTRANTTPVYDGYSALLNAANQWLSMNRKFLAIKCETIHRKMETMAMTDDDRMFVESFTGANVFVRGLRMWLTENPHPEVSAQEIGVVNKVPRKSEKRIGQQFAFRTHKQEPKIVTDDHPFWMKELSSVNVTFEGVDTILERLNEDLRENPIRGSIMNIELMTHTCSLLPTTSDLDPEQTYWYENDKTRRRFVKIIRLFYSVGTPKYERIGTEVFKPDITRIRKGINPTVFKPSTNTFDKLAKWITKQEGNSLIAVQTVNTRYNETEGNCEIYSDSMDDCESTTESQLYIETLRAFYISSSWNPPSLPPGTISCRTFVPVRLGGRQFETMSQSVYRIAAWLKVTGIPVFHVETLKYSFNEELETGVELNKCNFPKHSKIDLASIIVIRLYFSYPYKEPLSEFLPKAMPWTPIKGNRSELYHARRSFYRGLYSSRILNEPSLEDITSVNVAYKVQTQKSPFIFSDQM